MKPSALAAGLLAAGLFCAGSAHADASAEARLVNLSFEVFDLDSDDGIAAAFHLMPGVGLSSVSAHAYAGAQYMDVSRGAASFMSGLSVEAEIPGLEAGAKVTAKTLRAKAESEDGGHAGASASASAYGLQLAPNSLLKISADGSVTARSENLLYPGYLVEHAFALVGLYLYGPDAEGGSGFQSAASERTAYSGGSFADGMGSSGTLVVTFANVSSAPITGYLSAGASALAYGAAMIPEPETYALMLAGLVVMGGVVRRGRMA